MAEMDVWYNLGEQGWGSGGQEGGPAVGAGWRKRCDGETSLGPSLIRKASPVGPHLIRKGRDYEPSLTGAREAPG